MVALYMSQKSPHKEHEEVELILESYADSLHDLNLKIRGLLGQISDTREFIQTAMDEARNRIIRMSLTMEICMLGVSIGAVISGVFGNFYLRKSSILEDLIYQ